MAVAACGGVVLGIRLGFHNHAPKLAAVCLAFHQQATNEVGGDQLGRTGEKGWGERWKIPGVGLGVCRGWLLVSPVC